MNHVELTACFKLTVQRVTHCFVNSDTFPIGKKKNEWAPGVDCAGGRHRRQPGDAGLRGVLFLLQDDVNPSGSVPPHAHVQQPQGPPGCRWPDPLSWEWAKGIRYFHIYASKVWLRTSEPSYWWSEVQNKLNTADGLLNVNFLSCCSKEPRFKYSCVASS